jgi:hypothetical protein
LINGYANIKHVVLGNNGAVNAEGVNVATLVKEAMLKVVSDKIAAKIEALNMPTTDKEIVGYIGDIEAMVGDKYSALLGSYRALVQNKIDNDSKIGNAQSVLETHNERKIKSIPIGTPVEQADILLVSS